MSLSNKFILDDMEHKEDKFISSLEQLKSESSDVENSLECRILFGGYACSSKAITYLEDEDIWEIFHYIDDSFVVTQDLILTVADAVSGSTLSINWLCKFEKVKLSQSAEAVANYNQFTIFDD